MARYDYSQGLDKSDIEKKFFESVKREKYVIDKVTHELPLRIYNKLLNELGIYHAE